MLGRAIAHVEQFLEDPPTRGLPAVLHSGTLTVLRKSKQNNRRQKKQSFLRLWGDVITISPEEGHPCSASLQVYDAKVELSQDGTCLRLTSPYGLSRSLKKVKETGTPILSKRDEQRGNRVVVYNSSKTRPKTPYVVYLVGDKQQVANWFRVLKVTINKMKLIESAGQAARELLLGDSKFITSSSPGDREARLNALSVFETVLGNLQWPIGCVILKELQASVTAMRNVVVLEEEEFDESEKVEMIRRATVLDLGSISRYSNLSENPEAADRESDEGSDVSFMLRIVDDEDEDSEEWEGSEVPDGIFFVDGQLYLSNLPLGFKGRLMDPMDEGTLLLFLSRTLQKMPQYSWGFKNTKLPESTVKELFSMMTIPVVRWASSLNQGYLLFGDSKCVGFSFFVPPSSPKEIPLKFVGAGNTIKLMRTAESRDLALWTRYIRKKTVEIVSLEKVWFIWGIYVPNRDWEVNSYERGLLRIVIELARPEGHKIISHAFSDAQIRGLKNRGFEEVRVVQKKKKWPNAPACHVMVYDPSTQPAEEAEQKVPPSSPSPPPTQTEPQASVDESTDEPSFSFSFVTDPEKESTIFGEIADEERYPPEVAQSTAELEGNVRHLRTLVSQQSQFIDPQELASLTSRLSSMEKKK